MTEHIRKPANWEESTFENLFSIDAGQAYVAQQLNGNVAPVARFVSSRTNADACSYDLFEDRSVWFHSNAQDEVWSDVADFVQQMDFTGTYWSDCDDRDGFMVDEMDRDLLVHLWGEDEAREYFESHGGMAE
jgi:hypothetical protein